MEQPTYTDKVVQLLRRQRGKWIDGLRIAEVGGAYGWRSRISDARRLRGLTIQNRQRHVGKRVISEYRLTRRNTGGRAVA